MTDEKAQKTAHRITLSTQYFLYFGVMGIILPYFNLYCYKIGFSGFQIGVLSAVRTLSSLVFPLLWATLADRLKIRRPIYIFCNFLSAGIWLGYLYTVDFTAMLMISLFYGIFYSPIIGFLEAFTMDTLGGERRNYGRIRAWGSINFILVVMALGRLTDLYPVRIILILTFAGSLAQAIFSLAMPRFEKKENGSSGETGEEIPFMNREVALFLFSFFLMLVSHGTYYGFFSIHLARLGFGNTFIGFAWALASIAEIAVMVRSKDIFKRFSIENILIYSFFIAVVRWGILCFTTAPSVILLSQLLHAFTYGTFHMAGILYIDRCTATATKTFGQTVNNAVTYGLGMAVGLFFNGLFYEKLNADLFLVSGLIALAGGLILLAFNGLRPPSIR